MKIGDLIRVKIPGVKPYVGFAISVNNRGGALVRSFDGKFQHWCGSWCSEVISENRRFGKSYL